MLCSRHRPLRGTITHAYVTLALQSGSANADTTASRNCSTNTVQSLIHFSSPPRTKVPLAPFLLKARISLAPTHFANQTARSVGTSLFRHWSRSVLPRMPCGIVRLSRLSEMAGFARSLSQISRFVSVKVTRGGGLKVEGAVICPRCLRWLSTPMNMVDSALRPPFCFKAGNMANRADEASFWLPLSHVPFCMASVLHSSSW